MFSNMHVLSKKAIVMQNNNIKKVENVKVISRDNVVGMNNQVQHPQTS